MIKEVEKILKESGFKCFLKGDELVVPFKLDINGEVKLGEFVAREDGRVTGIIYDVHEILNRSELLREILKIPTRVKVSIGLDDENDLIFEVWYARMSKSVESFLGAFILFIKFIDWLKDQLKNNLVKPFSLDED